MCVLNVDICPPSDDMCRLSDDLCPPSNDLCRLSDNIYHLCDNLRPVNKDMCACAPTVTICTLTMRARVLFMKIDVSQLAQA